MLSSEWSSESLVFSRFNVDESSLVKSIFESNLGVQSHDPTFREWPSSVYEKLIESSDQTPSANDSGVFYLRKISTLDGQLVGYLQLEVNVPQLATLWIPMLCLSPEFQNCGYGAEIVKSAISEACSTAKIERIGLNVYAENVRAFRFWFKQGFTQIKAFEPENELGREYNCLVLYRSL